LLGYHKFCARWVYGCTQNTENGFGFYFFQNSDTKWRWISQ
jgi:hypothetical protein